MSNFFRKRSSSPILLLAWLIGRYYLKLWCLSIKKHRCTLTSPSIHPTTQNLLNDFFRIYTTLIGIWSQLIDLTHSMFPRCLRHESSAVFGGGEFLERAHDAALVVDDVQLQVALNPAAAGVQLEGMGFEWFSAFKRTRAQSNARWIEYLACEWSSLK